LGHFSNRIEELFVFWGLCVSDKKMYNEKYFEYFKKQFENIKARNDYLLANESQLSKVTIFRNI
jgi:hypothetical protein